MAITTDDFNKVWASTSPLTPYEFSEANYKQGWNFIGGTPPARQMWDGIQKLTDEKIQYIYNNMIPVGIVQAFAGATTPQGWLLCDGSAVSRTEYADLFAVIGTTYGNGDGSTTFNLPNLVNKFVEGSATSGTEKTAGLPNIEGSIALRRGNGNANTVISAGSGSLYRDEGTVSGYYGYTVSSSGVITQSDSVYISASRSSSIYGNSTTVQPPAVTMRYIIKY